MGRKEDASIDGKSVLKTRGVQAPAVSRRCVHGIVLVVCESFDLLCTLTAVA